MHSHLSNFQIKEVTGGVLILVLMEDALALSGQASQKYLSAVLILVLMEDALAQNFTRFFLEKVTAVLILVLMEDALAPLKATLTAKKFPSLNPCFNGRCTRTVVC